MMIKEVMMLVLVLLVCHPCGSGVVVNVSEKNGDNSKCLNQTIPCESLEFVSVELGRICSGLSILIDDIELSINGIISFENCTSLQISGKNFHTKVSCQRLKGFRFINVTNLTLQNLEIYSCGYEVGLIQFHSRAAMHVHQCSNVLFTNIAFYNSSFTALVMSDTVGSVVIKNCSFLSNYPLEQTPNNTFFPGGIHIQFSVSHPCIDTTYIIMDCCFENNTQERSLRVEPHPSSTSPSFSMVYGYGLGGGMGILFQNGSKNTTPAVDPSVLFLPQQGPFWCWTLFALRE
jgi:hypothetical protein